MKQLFLQIMKFGSVGLLATVIHYITAISLFSFEVSPMWANLFAFLVAFQVSFFGHYRWTFAAKDIRSSTAFQRFACVSLLGFLINETLLFLLLEWTPITPRWALFIVLLTVAGFTFLLSRTWAFSTNKSEGLRTSRG